MTLLEQLDQARAEEARLLEARKAAWDPDRGNVSMVYNFYNPINYHWAHKAWAEARDRVAALEKKLAEQEAAA